MIPGSHTAERSAREAGRLGKHELHSRDGAASANAAVDGGADLLNAARPILASPGTCIIFDKDLVHAGAPNLSSAIRYALYARMRFV